jgi:hypothetical protein
VVGVVARRIKGVKLGENRPGGPQSGRWPVIRTGIAKPVRSTRPSPQPRPRKAVKAPPIVVTRQELVLKPTTFLDAVNADRCLYFADNPMSEDGPDMPVCGAERAHEPANTRYCPYHVKRQGQYVTMQEAS